MNHHTSQPVCPACEEKLAQAHETLQNWFRGIKTKHSTAHVSWSYRNEEEQNSAHAAGKSELAFPNSAHNVLPSRAIDLFEMEADGQGVWDPSFFANLAADIALSGLPILWGGNFKSLGDSDHFALRVINKP